MAIESVGFGGGCHWCTEGVFQSLVGVTQVQQGWLSAEAPDHEFSEAVIVYFDSEQVDLLTLIKVHLLTHSSESEHSLREKYRSALYCFSDQQKADVEALLTQAAGALDMKVVTRVLTAVDFKRNQQKYRNYFYSDPDKPFCQSQILPKLNKLDRSFEVKLNPQCQALLAKTHDK